MSPWDWFKRAFSRFLVFAGRASRPEFWWFFGVAIILGFIVTLIVEMGIPLISDIIGLSWAIGAFFGFFASWSVQVRRLHDTGHTGWWILIGPSGVGFLVLLYWYLKPSDPGVNNYGPPPQVIVYTAA